MIKENKEALKNKGRDFFGKTFEANFKKKSNQGQNRKIYFNSHILNPKECPFKRSLYSVTVVEGVPMHNQEAFITTSPHKGQNQVQVSQKIQKTSNLQQLQPPQQRQ